MTSKSYYTTRIIADRRYSHLISNGDLAPGFFDPATGEPRPQPVAGDDQRVMVEYHNHKVNMASYLFFLGQLAAATFQSSGPQSGWRLTLALMPSIPHPCLFSVCPCPFCPLSRRRHVPGVPRRGGVL